MSVSSPISILFYSFPSLSLSLPFSSSFFFLECSLSSLCLWKPSTLSNCFWEGCTQQLAESCDNFKVIEQHCFLLLFHHPHPHSQSHFFFLPISFLSSFTVGTTTRLHSGESTLNGGYCTCMTFKWSWQKAEIHESNQFQVTDGRVTIQKRYSDGATTRRKK